MENKNSLSIAIFGILLSGSIVLSTFLATSTFTNVRSLDNTLSVTGSTKYKVTSDTVKWTSSISRTVKASELKSGYVSIANDLKNVTTFMTDNGIKESDIKYQNVFIDKDWSYNSNGTLPQDQLYVLRQNIEINSSEVDKVSALAKDAQKLSKINAMFSIQSVEFYYSKLPELRVSLLSDAIKDAKLRAQKIAESNNQKVGSLKSAAAGSVLVLSPNSIMDNNDYGAYDTGSIEKEIMVTVKASFILE